MIAGFFHAQEPAMTHRRYSRSLREVAGRKKRRAALASYQHLSPRVTNHPLAPSLNKEGNESPIDNKKRVAQTSCSSKSAAFSGDW
jgi:hypothetical protein